MASQSKPGVSRRKMLKTGAAALGGGAALLAGPAAAQGPQAPAVLTGTQTGRTFRGLVRHSITTGAESVLYPYRPGQTHGRIHRFGISAIGGTRLAFSAFLDGGPRELSIVERGIERTLVTVEPPSMVVFQDWSGDGAWIYYTVVRNGGPPDEAWRVHASGGAPERLAVAIPRGTQINGMSVNPVTGAIAYTGGAPTTELWLMEGFLPGRH